MRVHTPEGYVSKSNPGVNVITKLEFPKLSTPVQSLYNKSYSTLMTFMPVCSFLGRQFRSSIKTLLFFLILGFTISWEGCLHLTVVCLTDCPSECNVHMQTSSYSVNVALGNHETHHVIRQWWISSIPPENWAPDYKTCVYECSSGFHPTWAELMICMH